MVIRCNKRYCGLHILPGLIPKTLIKETIRAPNKSVIRDTSMTAEKVITIINKPSSDDSNLAIHYVFK